VLTVRRTLAESERAQAELLAEKKALEARLQNTEQRLQQLEARIDEDGRESSDMDVLNKRLAEELEDEREQHQKDLSERDFTIDQTRKKYQGKLYLSTSCYFGIHRAAAELAQLSEGKILSILLPGNDIALH